MCENFLQPSCVARTFLPPNYFSVHVNQVITLKMEAVCYSKTPKRPFMKQFKSPKNSHPLKQQPPLKPENLHVSVAALNAVEACGLAAGAECSQSGSNHTWSDSVITS
jgi:hypothetical protein